MAITKKDENFITEEKWYKNPKSFKKFFEKILKNFLENVLKNVKKKEIKYKNVLILVDS